MNEATVTAAAQEFNRAFGGVVQEYYATAILVSVLSIAIVIIFFVVLYLNRANIKRWIRNWLND